MLHIIITLIATLLLSLITSYLYTTEKYAQRILFKVLASTGFVFLGIFSLIWNNHVNIIFGGGIITGLVLGLIGDMLLSLHPYLSVREAEYFNLAGILAFILNHIVYAIVLIHFSGFKILNIFLIAILPLFVLLLIKFGIFEKAYKMNIAIIAYSVFISFLAIQSIHYNQMVRYPYSYIFMIACMMFIISDFILIFSNYSKFKASWMMPVCLMLYYSSQILFALSILLYI